MIRETSENIAVESYSQCTAWQGGKEALIHSLKVFFPTLLSGLLTLKNDKILDWSKLEAFADDILNVAKITISVFDRVENIVGRRRKCWLPAFSPFPTMFSKGVFLRVL